MFRLALVALVSVPLLGGCASSSQSRYTVTPDVQVSMKAPKKKAPQANYRVSPEESKLTGSGGSAK
jgi:hypothetical protein